MKKWAVAITLMLAAALAGCGEEQPRPAVHSDVDRIVVVAGETAEVPGLIEAPDAPDGWELVWEVGCTDIATADQDRKTVTGVTAGETNLLVLLKDQRGETQARSDISVVVAADTAAAAVAGPDAPRPHDGVFSEGEIASITAGALHYGQALGMAPDRWMTVKDDRHTEPLRLADYPTAGAEAVVELLRGDIRQLYDQGYKKFFVIAQRDESLSADWLLYVTYSK